MNEQDKLLDEMLNLPLNELRKRLSTLMMERMALEADTRRLQMRVDTLLAAPKYLDGELAMAKEELAKLKKAEETRNKMPHKDAIRKRIVAELWERYDTLSIAEKELLWKCS